MEAQSTVLAGRFYQNKEKRQINSKCSVFMLAWHCKFYYSLWGKSREKELCLVYITFEISIKHPSGEVSG